MNRTLLFRFLATFFVQICISFSVFSQTDTVSPKVYEKPEVMPQYAGGDSALISYITKHLHYPRNAMKNNVQGMVLIQFVINEEGDVQNITVLKSVDPELDSAAVAVVSTLPRFKSPGMQDGETVSVYYRVPISFALNK